MVKLYKSLSNLGKTNNFFLFLIKRNYKLFPQGFELGKIINNNNIKPEIKDDDTENEITELQSHWKSMESRVINRKIPSKDRSKPCRSNVPAIDEDLWAEAGLYDGTKQKNDENALKNDK